MIKRQPRPLQRWLVRSAGKHKRARGLGEERAGRTGCFCCALVAGFVWRMRGRACGRFNTFVVQGDWYASCKVCGLPCKLGCFAHPGESLTKPLNVFLQPVCKIAASGFGFVRQYCFKIRVLAPSVQSGYWRERPTLAKDIWGAFASVFSFSSYSFSIPLHESESKNRRLGCRWHAGGCGGRGVTANFGA